MADRYLLDSKGIRRIKGKTQYRGYYFDTLILKDGKEVRIVSGTVGKPTKYHS